MVLPNQRTKHSTFGSVVAFAGANLRFILDPLNFDFNGAELSIACLVSGVIPKTVLRSDFGSDLPKRLARITQSRSEKVAAASRLRQLIHFPSRQVVKIAADL